MRRIEERTGINFSTKWRQVQKYADLLPTPLERDLSKASKVLLLDATFTKIKGRDIAIHIAYDTGIGVVDYWLDETENKTAYNYILRRLESKEYIPICVVSDRHWSLLPAVRERQLPHQYCLFHLLQELRRKITRKHTAKPTGRNAVLYSRIKWILKTKKIEKLPEKIEFFRKKTMPFFQDKQSILDWFWHISPNAVLHLSYCENVANTTGLLENLNGQIKQRIKTFRGVKSEDSLHKLLKILFYFRKYK